MNTIIVSTDFSPTSLNAVNYAADMAAAIRAELTIFNVYSIPVVYTDFPIISIPIETLKEDSEKLLQKLKYSVLNRVGGEITVHIKSRMGNVTEELEDFCKTIRPFAVVIGTRGKTNYEKAVFGSSTLSIIKHLNWPVICVPPGKEFGKGIKNIGFACEFKEVTETTPVKTIKNILKEFSAQLHVINVDHNDKHFNAGTPEELSALNKMFEEDKPEYHFIDNPDIENGINEFAYTHKLDLLITIPKKHSLLEKVFKSSSTKQLIAQSTATIMCIHE